MEQIILNQTFKSVFEANVPSRYIDYSIYNKDTDLWTIYFKSKWHSASIMLELLTKILILTNQK